MFNFKEVFADETINVFGITERICNYTRGYRDTYLGSVL